MPPEHQRIAVEIEAPRARAAAEDDLRADGWRSVQSGYLLPVRVVRALFRGRLLAALRDALAADTLRLPADRSRVWVENLLQRLGRRPWNVRIQERYAHGRGVLIYLGRYLRGGPIGNHRLAFVDDQRVVFRYTDHRDGHAKSMALPLEQFVQRVTRHVPEPCRHVVRYFGLYARGESAARELARRAIGAPERDTSSPPVSTPTPVAVPDACCTVCGLPLVVLDVWRRGREPPHGV